MGLIKPGLVFSMASATSCLTRTALIVTTLGIAACGGGNGGGNGGGRVTPAPVPNDVWRMGVFNDADIYADRCAVPRTGIDPATNRAYPDKAGTVKDENNFLRSWSNDTYLWYKEIPDLNPANYSDPIEYFDLLKTTATTPSGKQKDQFHFVYDSADWYAVSEEGISAGYGFELAWIEEDALKGRNVVIAYTEPGSPAADANLLRGAKIISVDGYDFVNGTDATTIIKINEGLFPSALNVEHIFEVQDPGSNTTHPVTLRSTNVTKTPVQNVKIINTPTGRVGYFVFNDHIKTAELGLYEAISLFSENSVSDLVLDVRYNGGGYLYIASELAYMIAGGPATNGKIFEKTTFNDKHSTIDIFGNPITAEPFYNASEELNRTLPSLNLERVYIITSDNTCSASESIINGLRGIDVEVIQIGSKTCGKPYGFYPQDNCGTTYFTVQFKGVNHKGFGEYSDGFVPSAVDNGMDNVKGCELGDDFSHALGNEAEKNLATALNYRATGSCSLPPSATSLVRLQKTMPEVPSNVLGRVKKEPGLTNRIMR